MTDTEIIAPDTEVDTFTEAARMFALHSTSREHETVMQALIDKDDALLVETMYGMLLRRDTAFAKQFRVAAHQMMAEGVRIARSPKALLEVRDELFLRNVLLGVVGSLHANANVSVLETLRTMGLPAGLRQMGTVLDLSDPDDADALRMEKVVGGEKRGDLFRLLADWADRRVLTLADVFVWLGITPPVRAMG